MTTVETITVERLDPIKAGENERTGRAWVIYDVIGTDANGTALAKVRTFDKLPAGEQRVEWETSRYGTTVRPAKADPLAAVLARLDALEAQVAKLSKGRK